MFAYVGCYTTPDRQGRGEGIVVYRVDPTTGAWTFVQLLADVPNPAFLALHPQLPILYCVHGGNTYSAVSAFAIAPGAGTLTFLNTQPSGGANPAHLDIDPTGRLLAVANYTGGTVAALPLAEDGTLQPPGNVLAQTGAPGPHPSEQASAHPHDIPFDRAGRFVVAPDKGLDRLFSYRADFAAGQLVPNEPPSVATHPGAGPRHIAFHPNQQAAYVINELDSTVTAYGYDATLGTLTPQQTLSSVPPDYTGANSGAEIAVDAAGRFLYISNRGHDSIAIFAIDATTGSLIAVGWEPTRGAMPRFFGLNPAGDFLYAANQDSDTIVAFRVDPTTGLLAATGQVTQTGSPSCIVFAEW